MLASTAVYTSRILPFSPVACHLAWCVMEPRLTLFTIVTHVGTPKGSHYPNISQCRYYPTALSQASLYPCAVFSLLAQSYPKGSSSTPRTAVSTIYPRLRAHSFNLVLNSSVAPNIFLLLFQVRKDSASFFNHGNDRSEALFITV